MCLLPEQRRQRPIALKPVPVPTEEMADEPVKETEAEVAEDGVLVSLESADAAVDPAAEDEAAAAAAAIGAYF